MARVETAARAILTARGVDLDALQVPMGLESSTSWDLAWVAECHHVIVGMVRASDLGNGWLALDQVSVDPAHARRGIGRQLLVALAGQARELGWHTITGTTFRTLAFNAPFYATLTAVEDPAPHPVMVERRSVERELGLDGLAPRTVMRMSLRQQGGSSPSMT